MGGTRRGGDGGGGGGGRGGEVAEEEADGAGVASAQLCGQVRRVRPVPGLARAGASGNSGIGVGVGGRVLPGGVAVRVWRPLLLAVTPSTNLTTSATPPAVRLFSGGRRGT